MNISVFGQMAHRSTHATQIIFLFSLIRPLVCVCAYDLQTIKIRTLDGQPIVGRRTQLSLVNPTTTPNCSNKQQQ